jgi:transcriptional regulator with XRE-family HTH domain
MRAERGLSLREAARRAGVVKETISDIERGKTHPYDVTLAKLAQAYEVPIERLLEPSLDWALTAPDKEFDEWVGTATLHEVLVLNYRLSEAAAREDTGTEAYRLMFDRLKKVMDRFYFLAGLGLIQETESSRRRRAREERQDATDAGSEAG